MVLDRRAKISRREKAMLIALRNDKSQCDQGVSGFKFERKSVCRVAVRGILWHGRDSCDAYAATPSRDTERG